MNIQSLMNQARKLQGELEKTTREIENKVFNYENENILVEITGKNAVSKIKIKNENIINDVEMLEDILTVAINNVLEQIKLEKDKKLGKYTNGLGGLF
ncbi:nucleoid-associated protein CXIVA_09260 [Clostridium sp. CAG:1000]|jgi:DNA-binding protein YbaB|nr:nucleoid-associated protein CXIVA_09260 [Clostridium sp. CAG:1000]